MIVEKTNIKQEEFLIVNFLLRVFIKTKAFTNEDMLFPEAEHHINAKRKRVADLAYFTAAQMKAANKGKRQSSTFVIEILSPCDIKEQVEDKIQDYFNSGTKIIWYISPKHQQIYVYTSPIDVKIYKGNAVCSAAPVLPDFSFKVKEMFDRIMN